MPKLLDEIVAARGDELALADEFGRTTWSKLDERTRRLINAFKGASIGPGDTIALMLGNRRECFEIFQAAAHLGVTYVPVNWHCVADELAYVRHSWLNEGLVPRANCRGYNKFNSIINIISF